MQAQFKQNNQQPLAPSNGNNSKGFNAIFSKNRQSIGRLPSEFNVEITTKWIPKSALAKMNLPDNYVLENTNAMINIAALEKNPKGAKSSNCLTMREPFNLKDAISTKKQNLDSNVQD